MNSVERMAAGRERGAKTMRKKAEENYYRNPAYCSYCGKIIPLVPGVKPSETKSKKFCDRSCAAKHNNRAFPKRKIETQKKCERCGIDIELKKGSNYKRKYCPSCVTIVSSEKTSQRFPNARVRRRDIPFLTKRELLEKAGSAYRFKLYVTWHAKRVFREVYTGITSCPLCGFEHIQICHLKDVSAFDDETTIEEVNSPENLAGLCPNHHWLLDHNKLSYDDLAEIEKAHHCK